ncbi:MAG: hypothetical protein QM597_04110 [Aeromicrobium sp.]|uniref:hypothetical protein n=1 Tax=Aeromicrobium sp. TaxID=1871063 RepID=UPI0039E66ECA
MSRSHVLHVRQVLALALIAVVAFFGLGAAPAQAVGVEDNVSPNTTNYGVASGNVYYIWVDEGEWFHYWANGGTAIVTAPDGTQYSGSVASSSSAVSTSRQATAATAGVWRVVAGGGAELVALGLRR